MMGISSLAVEVGAVGRSVDSRNSIDCFFHLSLGDLYLLVRDR